MKNKALQITLTLILSATGLYLALRGVDFKNVGEALRSARWHWVMLGAGCMLLSFWLRGHRWRLLLNDKISIPDAFGLINVGYLVSNIFPLRAGDPARAVAASLRGPVSAMAALSTVVVERILDMVTISLIMVITLPFIAGIGDSATPGFIGGGAAILILVVLVLMALYPGKVEAIARWFLERLPLGNPERWLRPLRGILDGLQALRSPRKGLGLAIYSIGIWLAVVIYYIVLFQALPVLKTEITRSQILIASVVTWATALGMTTPTQAGLGGYHVAARLALTLPFQISLDLATTYGWLAWAISYLLGVILGAGTLLIWGISLKDIRGVRPENMSHEGE